MIRQSASAALPAASTATDSPARANGSANPTALGAAAVAAVAAPQPAVSREDVRRAAADANERLRQTGSELTFEFNDEVGRVVVRLVDTRTREVLRQFPSEEMLQIARALKQDKLAGALLRAAA